MVQLMSAPVKAFRGAVVMLALALPMEAARAFDTPEDLLTDLYAGYAGDGFPKGVREYLSVGMGEEWDALHEADAYGLGFDPVVDGQDFVVTDISIGSPLIEEGKTEVLVRFENFGEPRRMIYVLVQEPDGWKIDNIKAIHGEQIWSLRGVVASAWGWIGEEFY